MYENETQWKKALKESSIRVQWDPDHDPSGRPLKRRAIQLGLRGAVLKQYSRDKILEILDVSEFVSKQRKSISSNNYSSLIVPREWVYIPKIQRIYL